MFKLNAVNYVLLVILMPLDISSIFLFTEDAVSEWRFRDNRMIIDKFVSARCYVWGG